MRGHPGRRFSWMATIVLLAFSSAAAFAQDPEPSPNVTGRVLDSSGAPVAAATVLAVREDSVVASTTTDGQGIYRLALAPGAYTLRFAAEGFVETAQSLNLAAGEREARDAVLEVAGVQETVRVDAPGTYEVRSIRSATKTATPLSEVPQSVTVVTEDLIDDQRMLSMGDVVRYVPGITAHQGENNRDDVVIRGNRSSADFFVNGVRDDVQYYRDLYNLERVEALKGPNAMIFGRGGGGGVVNRVTKEAEFRPFREVTLMGGGFDSWRATADFDQPLGGGVALRINGVYEDSGSFRDFVGLDRAGINPTLTFAPGEKTRITLGYEYLQDDRVADRGITSFQGRPADVDIATFYGNPADSDVRLRVNLGTALVEHQFGSATLRNRTVLGDYDRFYQNYVPGPATSDASQVLLTAYNNATDRQNLFNQTDVTFTATAGSVHHTLLGGVELGLQKTDNFRKTGFFNDTTLSVLAPFDAPTIATPVTFRQSATDADNHVEANIAAVYVQDQARLSEQVQLIGGLRYDRFDLEYHNNRNGDTLGRVDDLLSPRAGVVYEPVKPLSLYAAYSVSYLPGSGDQFSSLTVITEQLEPEKFTNYEVGAKWDPLTSLSLTAAAYRLDRTNTRSTDPNDPTRIVQTGSQRTDGFELGVNGQITDRWKIAGGYAYQDAFVTSATAAAREGAVVGQVPRHSFSLWNNYQFTPKIWAGVGIVSRSEMFASIDNTVTLPGYARIDLAASWMVFEGLRLQANLENAFDTTYYVNADSNTNISPGAPRVLRVGVTTSF